MGRKTTSLTPTQQRWLSHVRRCHASADSVAEYARKQRISAPQLYTWISRLRRLGALDGEDPQRRRTRRSRKSEPQFSPVRIVSEERSTPLRIRFANGIVLELAGPGVPDAELLTTLASLP